MKVSQNNFNYAQKNQPIIDTTRSVSCFVCIKIIVIIAYNNCKHSNCLHEIGAKS